MRHLSIDVETARDLMCKRLRVARSAEFRRPSIRTISEIACPFACRLQSIWQVRGSTFLLYQGKSISALELIHISPIFTYIKEDFSDIVARLESK